MAIQPGLIGIILLCIPTQTIEPVNERHATHKFDVEGGHYQEWTRKNFAPPTVKSPPYEVRFVITGINEHEEWSSNIGFFFEGPIESDDEKTESSVERKAEYRLRFVWDRKACVLFPKMGYMVEKEEKDVGRIDHPIALNQPVTITIRRQDEDLLILSLDGHEFVHFTGKLELMTVHASGLKGEISLQRE